MRLNLDGYFISDEKHLLSVAAIHDYLSRESYWARGRSRERVEISITHSLCFGVYTREAVQAGFARAVTDHATTYYICDLFILPVHRGQDLSKRLMEFIVGHPRLAGLSGLLLTRDAHGLYRRYGFSDAGDVQARFMLKPREQA
jgi:GNAT superfamily N-acetyltransferase